MTAGVPLTELSCIYLIGMRLQAFGEVAKRFCQLIVDMKTQYFSYQMLVCLALFAIFAQKYEHTKQYE